MSPKVARLLKAVTSLSPLERKDFDDGVLSHRGASGEQKILLERNFSKTAGIDLGPIDSSKCPACGK